MNLHVIQKIDILYKALVFVCYTFTAVHADSSAVQPIKDLGASTVVAAPISRSDALNAEDALHNQRLERSQAVSLAETLRDQPGLAIRSMGPAPARPVLRGLSGEHVVVREDAGSSGDLSATSPDHAVATEALSIQRVAIVRGPRLMLYSPSAAGALVDVERGDIPSHTDHWSGEIRATMESGQPGGALALWSLFPAGAFVLRGELSGRFAQDMQTAEGSLDHSALRNTGGAAGFSFSRSNWEWGASARMFRSAYEIPGGFVGAHPRGVDIELEKTLLTLQGKGRIGADSLLLLARLHHYGHQEFESNGRVGAEFISNGQHVRLERVLHSRNHRPDLRYGLELEARRLDMGGYVFTPPTQAVQGSFFFLSSWRPGVQGMELSLGGRSMLAAFRPESSVVADPNALRNRTFKLWSVSAEWLQAVQPGHYFYVNMYRTQRPPSIEELYSQGPHLAAYTYEVGDRDLEAELGYGGETGWKMWRGDWKGRFSVFATWFDHYLIPRATGDTNWSQILPIYAVQGKQAWMHGAEWSLERAPVKGLGVLLGGGYVRGWFLPGRDPLPQVPPLRTSLELSWSCFWGRTAAIATAVSAQKHTDLHEEPTDGYVLGSLTFSKEWRTSAWRHHLVLGVDNVTDASARNHLSRLKSLMPEKGRSFHMLWKTGW